MILTPTHLAIVMEYASGGELFERICNAGRFSEDEVLICYSRVVFFEEFYVLIVILITGSLLFPTTCIWSQLLPLDGNLFFWSPHHRCKVLIFFLFISLAMFVLMKEVCHRDLKLENTLLDGSAAPRLKICDFGYSKVLSHHWFLI